MSRLAGDDHVLLVSLANLDVVEACAPRCRMLVGLGDDDQVRAARRQFAALDNVMFTVGSRDEIPWRDGQFTVVIDADSGEPTAEMLRVLGPSGRVVRDWGEWARGE